MLKAESIKMVPLKRSASTRSCPDEYQDPLLKWPLRGAAYTNEVGEALRPVIGEYATLSWVPALLYFGADIYDKYKNDNMEYKPDHARGLKQAIFQSMASIVLPLAAVKSGQGLFSYFGLISKDKVAISTQEQISEFATRFIADGNMRKYKNDSQACVEDFIGIVNNNLDYKNAKNPFKKFVKSVEEKLLPDNRKKINEYAKNTISDLINLRQNLLVPSEEFQKSACFEEFINAKNSGQTSNVAVKTVLTKFQNNKVLKGKMIKTVGGFVALFALIKPIDNFVEKFLIDKIVTPTIEKKRNPV